MIDREDAKFAVGKGWSDLIDLAYNVFEKEGVNVLQVKEKYGTLRIYVGPTDARILGYISALENMSGHICEECGSRGELRTKGWWKTLCDDCERKHSKKHTDYWNACPKCSGQRLQRTGNQVLACQEYVTDGVIQHWEAVDWEKRVGTWHLHCEDCGHEWEYDYS